MFFVVSVRDEDLKHSIIICSFCLARYLAVHILDIIDHDLLSLSIQASQEAIKQPQNFKPPLPGQQHLELHPCSHPYNLWMGGMAG